MLRRICEWVAERINRHAKLPNKELLRIAHFPNGVHWRKFGGLSMVHTVAANFVAVGNGAFPLCRTEFRVVHAVFNQKESARHVELPQQWQRVFNLARQTDVKR